MNFEKLAGEIGFEKEDYLELIEPKQRAHSPQQVHCGGLAAGSFNSQTDWLRLSNRDYHG